MKVYVTQGHEQGIGLEVFFKSCLFLNPKELAELELLAYKESVIATLKSLKTPFEINYDSIDLSGTIIPTVWLNKVETSQSFTSLKLGMEKAQNQGVLFTLPTSKDQFPHHAGHTEYFRDFYQNQNLGMFFSSPGLQVLLLSDHLALHSLSEELSQSVLSARLTLALKTLSQWSWPTKRILVAGFNPHAGENGLIGNEDERIRNIVKQMKDDLKLNITGPLPGDTMLFEQKSPDDLLVYVYHDQGLGVFKSLRGFIGSNITLGLPYPRLSPDHGTSFALFGKNEADYRGCAFSLKQALSMLKKVSHEKNSSHKSKSS